MCGQMPVFSFAVAEGSFAEHEQACPTNSKQTIANGLSIGPESMLLSHDHRSGAGMVVVKITFDRESLHNRNRVQSKHISVSKTFFA